MFLIIIGSIVIGVTLFVYVAGFFYRYTSGVCKCKNQLHGKTVIITGATSGIGKETALDLASRGARVIIAAKYMEEGESARKWIVSSTGNKNIVVRHLELSDMDSVRKFVEETLKIETRLDILINNAGIAVAEKELSKQGYELTLATNYYGHFLLTNLLLDLIKKSSPSRIINVASGAHKRFHFDLDDIHFQKRKYNGVQAYSQSKVCTILFTKELAHRLGNKEVTVNALHPGLTASDIGSHQKHWLAYVFTYLKPGFKNCKLGAQTSIHLAVSNQAAKVTGEYFVDCKIAEISKKSLDPGLARQLWELSEEEVGLTNEKKFI